MAQPAETKRDLALDTLGNPVRRQLLGTLAARPLAVGELADKLPISRPAVSKHLRLLSRADLVAFDKRGNRNVFRLSQAGFDAARDWLDSFWDGALARFALVAENTYADEGDL